MYGVVPLGVPLLSSCGACNIDHYPGPLRLCLFYHFLILNLIVCAVVLMFSQYIIIKYLGKRFVERVKFSVIIASIAIMFIRKGLQGVLDDSNEPPPDGLLIRKVIRIS